MTPDSLPQAYRSLLDSPRVSQRTRRVLTARLTEPEGVPALEPAHLAALRAVTARIIPQEGELIDLAARVDAVLAGGIGDGWRVATQPPDVQAYRAGLDALDGAARAEGHDTFAQLPPERQDALLRVLDAGDPLPGDPLPGDPLPGAPGTLSPGQLKVWFQEVRSDATRAYVSHPLTLARMSYSGNGYGGDGERLQGFHALRPGEREAWEPTSEGASA